MKVNIKGKEVELKYSFRALMVYENITGKAFNPKNLSDIINFFYSCVLSQSMKESEIIGYEDFLDWLDDSPEELNSFSAWLMDMLGINDRISPEPTHKVKQSEEEADGKN